MENPTDYELMYKEYSIGNYMCIKDLKRLGKHGYELYCVEKETWKRPGGSEEKKKEKYYTNFRYCFARKKGTKEQFDYKEVVIWHTPYKEDALHYFLNCWIKVASFDHLKEKEAGIIEDGQRSTIICPCYVHYYKRKIN